MPVTLYRVDHAIWAADAQVACGLSRIYADAPPDRLPQPSGVFVEMHLRAGGVFYCARFNARLLGAVAARVDDEEWWLSHMCVRKTTRRRGVGSRMLALVAAAAAQEGCVIRVHAASLMMGDQLLLSRLGYRLVAGGDHFELNPLPSHGGH
ncbi:acetyl-CoA sensor PanZ family protein [Aidingimonas lacisalsi]|uniref:acetyl-CoA sensor PanZ family protein n=1 Tax=Aidingimonas lacisalsi TaxID=2604086 RepID=UPI0011D256C3|nr:acetyl-CoA sensor PanZ family protein [Aidingimonas lacisalsi]